MAKDPQPKNDGAPGAQEATGAMPPSPFVPMPAPRVGGARPLGPPGSVGLNRFIFQRPAEETQVRAMAKNAGDTLAGGLEALSKAASKVRQMLAGVTDEQRALWAELQGLVTLADLEAGAAAFEELAAKFAAE